MLTSDDNQAIKNLKYYILHRCSIRGRDTHTISNVTHFMRKRNEINRYISSHQTNVSPHDEDSSDEHMFNILDLLSQTLFAYNPTRAGRFIDFVILMSGTEQNSHEQTPLTEEKIEKIEKSIFKNLTREGIGHDLSTNCPICQEQYTQDDDVSILPCNGKHYYHTDCIKGWFKVGNVCPVCREDIANKI